MEEKFNEDRNSEKNQVEIWEMKSNKKVNCLASKLDQGEEVKTEYRDLKTREMN
jgi:hypothetical protein